MSIEDELKSKGIDPGIWQEFQLGKATPDFLKKNQAILVQLRDILQQQMEADMATVAKLKEIKNKDQFGGGE